VHWTLGILRDLQAFFPGLSAKTGWLRVFSAPEQNLHSAHLQLTLAVETVEKEGTHSRETTSSFILVELWQNSNHAMKINW
jgi:hypothetical protein